MQENTLVSPPLSVLSAQVVPSGLDLSNAPYTITVSDSDGLVVSQTQRCFEEFGDLMLALPTLRTGTRFPSRKSGTLGLNPNETKSLAQALEAWLGEVLTCLACREIHDDGVWSICHFLALEDANTVHIISADEIWRLTLEERLANAERRVNALEKEKSDLEADALCLRQERTHANRAALSANRERSISHAQRPQATPDHAHFLSTGDDLEARCVALGAERDELKRKADRLAMRHADVLLRIGGQQLESSAAAKAAALEGSQKSVPSRMPPAATKLPPRTPASECLCFGSCLAGPGSC